MFVVAAGRPPVLRPAPCEAVLFWAAFLDYT